MGHAARLEESRPAGSFGAHGFGDVAGKTMPHKAPAISRQARRYAGAFGLSRGHPPMIKPERHGRCPTFMESQLCGSRGQRVPIVLRVPPDLIPNSRGVMPRGSHRAHATPGASDVAAGAVARRSASGCSACAARRKFVREVGPAPIGFVGRDRSNGGGR